jgi:hypothetical protein
MGKFVDKYEEVAILVKNDFLNRYFGPDEELQYFALTSLREGLTEDTLTITW